MATPNYEYSGVCYTATAGQTTFALTTSGGHGIGYLKPEHIKVRTSADSGNTWTGLTLDTDYVFADPATSIVLNAGAAVGTLVDISRHTPMDEDWIVFQVGSLLTAGQLNEFETWQLYIDQELADKADNLTGPDVDLSTTDDLPEGSTNLYYTDARVETYVSGAGYIKDAGVTKIKAGTNVFIDPADGTGEVTINATGGGGGGIPEAPTDGKTYGRNNASWTEVTGGGGGGIPEAPTDGKLYGRQNSGWSEVTATGGVTKITAGSDNVTLSPSEGTGDVEITVAAGGPKGDAATVDVGTTTTGDAGTQAEVTNSGDTSAAVFNFKIPKGDKGEPGQKGDQGDGAKNTISGTEPAEKQEGDFWTDTSGDDPVLKTWDGSAWVEVGAGGGGASGTAPLASSANLYEVTPGGNRFTGQSFTTSVTMAEQGVPYSNKKIKAKITGSFPVYPESETLDTVVDQSASPIYSPTADKFYPGTGGDQDYGYAKEYNGRVSQTFRGQCCQCFTLDDPVSGFPRRFFLGIPESTTSDWYVMENSGPRPTEIADGNYYMRFKPNQRRSLTRVMRSGIGKPYERVNFYDDQSGGYGVSILAPAFLTGNDQNFYDWFSSSYQWAFTEKYAYRLQTSGYTASVERLTIEDYIEENKTNTRWDSFSASKPSYQALQLYGDNNDYTKQVFIFNSDDKRVWVLCSDWRNQDSNYRFFFLTCFDDDKPTEWTWSGKIPQQVVFPTGSSKGYMRDIMIHKGQIMVITQQNDLGIGKIDPATKTLTFSPLPVVPAGTISYQTFDRTLNNGFIAESPDGQNLWYAGVCSEYDTYENSTSTNNGVYRIYSSNNFGATWQLEANRSLSGGVKIEKSWLIDHWFGFTYWPIGYGTSYNGNAYPYAQYWVHKVQQVTCDGGPGIGDFNVGDYVRPSGQNSSKAIGFITNISIDTGSFPNKYTFTIQGGGTYAMGGTMNAWASTGNEDINRWVVIGETGNITDVSLTEPDFVDLGTGDNLTIQFPGLFPSSLTPDQEFPEGSTIQTTVKAENTVAASTVSSNVLEPGLATPYTFKATGRTSSGSSEVIWYDENGNNINNTTDATMDSIWRSQNYFTEKLYTTATTDPRRGFGITHDFGAIGENVEFVVTFEAQNLQNMLLEFGVGFLLLAPNSAVSSTIEPVTSGVSIYANESVGLNTDSNQQFTHKLKVDDPGLTEIQVKFILNFQGGLQASDDWAAITYYRLLNLDGTEVPLTSY